MDNILQISSTVFSLLDARIDMPEVSGDLFYKTGLYIQKIRQTCCGKYFANNPVYYFIFKKFFEVPSVN